MRVSLRNPLTLALLTVLLLALPAASAAPPTGKKVFPYPIHKKTLANGLDTLVLAGARNEIEPGKASTQPWIHSQSPCRRTGAVILHCPANARTGNAARITDRRQEC